MRKLATAVAVAATVTQAAVPALAADVFNSSTALGWQRISAPAAFAYFRVPLDGGQGLAPRLGVAITGPQAFNPGNARLQLDAPHALDLGVTVRGFDAPWQSNAWRNGAWTGTLMVGNTVAWSSNPDALSPSERTNLFSGPWTWVAVGLLTAGAVAGVFVLADR